MTERHDGRMQLDVESLRTFMAVLDRGGMTRAAEFLGVTQSAVSWKIKRLEQRVGRPLLLRDGHDLRPSRDGRVILDEARSIVEAHDRLVHRLESPDFTGTMRVGANEEIAPTRMAGILGRFRELHPEATIEFVVNQTRLLRPMLQRAQVDVAVIEVTDEELRPDDVVLWSDELHWVTHRDVPHTEGVGPLVTFGDNGFVRPVLEPILKRHGIDYEYTVATPNSTGVRAMVAAGLGVAVLPSWFLDSDDEVVEWTLAESLDPLPTVHQVVRTVPGEVPSITAPLIAAITDEFMDLRVRPDHELV